MCTALGIRPGSIAWAPKQVAQSLRSGFTAVERMSGSPQLLGGGRAAGVERGHRPDRGEGLVAGLGVGLLVGAGVGPRVEQDHVELAAAEVVAGVEVRRVRAGRLLGRLEDAGHRAGDVGDVRQGDRGVGDAGLVLEAVAAAGLGGAGGGVAAGPLARASPADPPPLLEVVVPLRRWCRRRRRRRRRPRPGPPRPGRMPSWATCRWCPATAATSSGSRRDPQAARASESAHAGQRDQRDRAVP